MPSEPNMDPQEDVYGLDGLEEHDQPSKLDSLILAMHPRVRDTTSVMMVSRPPALDKIMNAPSPDSANPERGSLPQQREDGEGHVSAGRTQDPPTPQQAEEEEQKEEEEEEEEMEEQEEEEDAEEIGDEEDTDESTMASEVDLTERGSINPGSNQLSDNMQTRSLRTRRNRGQGSFSSIFRRLVDERVRHKRQTLQDMARPLKQWLYRHRDNPYPTKSEKIALAQGSQMTLTQVSNWFANARRRLKNTVRDPNLSWAKRIKLYNSHVVGNAELLSVSSEDSFSETDDEREYGSTLRDSDNYTEKTVSTPKHEVPEYGSPPGRKIPRLSAGARAWQLDVHGDCYVTSDVSAQSDDGSTEDPSQPHKYKQSILQRYLNDSYEHSFQVQGANEHRKRNPSGSLSSHDYETLSTSSRSSPVHEHNSFEDPTEDLELLAKQWGQAVPIARPENDMYWKEISAALALTTLARSRTSTSKSVKA